MFSSNRAKEYAVVIPKSNEMLNASLYINDWKLFWLTLHEKTFGNIFQQKVDTTTRTIANNLSKTNISKFNRTSGKPFEKHFSCKVATERWE